MMVTELYTGNVISEMHYTQPPECLPYYFPGLLVVDSILRNTFSEREYILIKSTLESLLRRDLSMNDYNKIARKFYGTNIEWELWFDSKFVGFITLEVNVVNPSDTKVTINIPGTGKR